MNWKDKLNKQYLQISLYVIITVVVIYSLSLMVRNAPIILAGAMTWFHWLVRVSKPVIYGFVFAYLMDPVVEAFERRYQRLKTTRFFKRIVMPRTWAAFTSVFLLSIAVLALITLLVFTITNQIRLITLEDVTTLGKDYLNGWNSFYDSIIDRLDSMNIQSQELEQYVKDTTVYITNYITGFVRGTFNSITNISRYFTTFIFSFIIGFYFMIDGRMFLSYIRRISKALFPDALNDRMKNMAGDLDRVFSGYIRGQLIDATVMMFLISIVLSLTGVKFAVVIGILAGLGNLIPYFGPIVAYVSTSLVCFINQDLRTWVISMIMLFLIQSIDGNLIGPKLLSSSIKIHPLIIIVSIIFGSALGGFLGMLLAVPVGAYLKLVFARFIDHRLRKKEGNITNCKENLRN